MPYTKSWLDLERSMGGRYAIQGTPDEIKQTSALLKAKLAAERPPPSKAILAEDGDVEGIKYRLYTPTSPTKDEFLPVGVFTHAGGWMIGNLDSEDPTCRQVAEHARCIIVSVDYRLTPDFKAPTQFQDTMKVYSWALRNATSFGGDPNRFFSIGGSAGGALALQVANQLVRSEATRGQIRGVAALVPITLHQDHVPEEYRPLYKAMEENATNVPINDKNSMCIFYEHAGVDAKDVNTFAALAIDNHKNFPPTYLASCEYDPLRDDSFVMEYALKKAGVPVKHDYYEGLPHYFWNHPIVPESKLLIANLVEGVKWLINQM